MPINRDNPKSLERYRQYQREYQREYVKTHPRDQKNEKYAIYKKISIIFRKILL
jgi:hypothetical protein